MLIKNLKKVETNPAIRENMEICLLKILWIIRKTSHVFFCGKKGHFKKEYRFYKKLKTEANAGQKNANVVENSPPNNIAEIVAMVGGLSINMVNDWWYDSGATI